MTAIISSSTLDDETAAALMDIDGVDLDEVGGFASIDNDASDEPTRILMIHGLQEALNASDIGRAVHSHFDPVLKAASSPKGRCDAKPWLSKVFTLHSITGSDGTAGSQSISNVGKAFVVCSDVDVATHILDAFEEQYLDSEVNEGFRLKLPEDVAKRLVSDAGMTSEQAATTDQLLICYATPAIFQQCTLDDKRDAPSTIPVQTDWGEVRFSYRDLSHGVQTWDASELFPTRPAPLTPEKEQVENAEGPSKKRSRSAMIREELRQQQQQQQREPSKLSLKEEGLKLGAAIHQAKIDFLREQIAHGVQVFVPPELQSVFPEHTFLGPAHQSHLSVTSAHGHMGLPMTPSGARLGGPASLPSRPLNTFGTPASLPRPPVPLDTPAETLVSPMGQLPKAPQNTPFGAHLPPQSQRGSVHAAADSSSIAANPRDHRGVSSSPMSPAASNGRIEISTSNTQAATRRRRGFSDRPDPDSGPSSPAKAEHLPVHHDEADEGALRNGSSLRSRWDIKNGKESTRQQERLARKPEYDEETASARLHGDLDARSTSGPSRSLNHGSEHSSVKELGSVPVSEEERHSKIGHVNGSGPTGTSPAAAEPASHARSTSRRASARHRIPGPAQAPPILVSSTAHAPNGEGHTNAPSTNRSVPANPTIIAAPDTLEVPSGLRLPAPMEGLTRSIGRNDEVPLDYDFCNQDRLLCLLCMRVFKSSMTMKKHVWESSLHKKNVEDPDMRRKGVLHLYSSFMPPKEADIDGVAPSGQPSAHERASSAAAPVETPGEGSDQGGTATLNANTTASPVSPAYRDRAMERRAVYRGE